MLEHDLPKREPLMLTVPTTDFGSCLYVAKCQRLTIRSDQGWILHYAYLQNLVKLYTMIFTRLSKAGYCITLQNLVKLYTMLFTRLEVWTSSFPLCECIRCKIR